ncbi:allantoicase [Yunchengibacter salinarum]|uniref:allantoicase n=1 Tax=Yunchengibacter salinarum TaxID=3133399 RepID=UPI0035B5853B
MLPDCLRHCVNLAEPRLGAKATHATDDFFAPRERMLKTSAPVFLPDEYDDHGKWMDGWESRRKREPGHDHATVRLGGRAVIRGVNLDTTHFTGNYAPAASIEACISDRDVPGDEADWTEILPAVDLSGDSHNIHLIHSDQAWTHVRLHIYPDGGVARLRIYGHFAVDWDRLGADGPVDLAALENGGRAVAAIDEHFGVLSNILLPGRGMNMGDGWETRRRREPGNDWGLIALGHAGRIGQVIVDTAHFKGNFPHRISLQAGFLEGGTDASAPVQSQFWPYLLPEQPLSADAVHDFIDQVADVGPVSHVRINLVPDGGISRLRLIGTPDR